MVQVVKHGNGNVTMENVLTRAPDVMVILIVQMVVMKMVVAVSDLSTQSNSQNIIKCL